MTITVDMFDIQGNGLHIQHSHAKYIQYKALQIQVQNPNNDIVTLHCGNLRDNF